MNRLAILGASGHGRVIADAALLSGDWQEVVFFDDAYPRLQSNGTYLVAGDTNALINSGLSAIVAIGDNRIRLDKALLLQQHRVHLVSVIHPAAIIAKDSHINCGTVVFAGAVVNSGAVVGSSCIINSRAVVEHDCLISDAVHISPGANLGGGCQIDVGAWIGIGAAVRHGIKIGCFSIVGTGAAVVHDVTAHEVVVGVPARPLKKNG